MFVERKNKIKVRPTFSAASFAATIFVTASVFMLLVSAALAPTYSYAAEAVVGLTNSDTAALGAGMGTNLAGKGSACGKFSVTGDYCLLTGPLGSFFTDGKVHIKANGLSVYLNTLYKIGVAVATGLALIFITIGGVKYASTDAIGGHEEGIKYINNALFGLVLVVGSYVMLNAINPDLLKSDLPLKDSVNLTQVKADTTGLQVVNDGHGGTISGGTSDGSKVQPFTSTPQTPPTQSKPTINNPGSSGSSGIDASHMI